MACVGREIESANVLKQLNASNLLSRDKEILYINGLTVGELDLSAVIRQHVISCEDATVHVKRREKTEDKGGYNILALAHTRLVSLLNNFDVKTCLNFKNKLYKQGLESVLRSDLELSQIYIFSPWILNLLNDETLTERLNDVTLDLIPFLVKN